MAIMENAHKPEAETREAAYKRRKSALEVRCNGCKQRSIERCDVCTVGRQLRYLEVEYSDVTGWSHNYWQK